MQICYKHSKPLSLSLEVGTSNCSSVGFLEHVVVTTSLSLATSWYKSYDYQDYYDDHSVLKQSGPRRGDVSVQMVSPSGPTSLLLLKRPNNYVNEEGYSDWAIHVTTPLGRTS